MINLEEHVKTIINWAEQERKQSIGKKDPPQPGSLNMRPVVEKCLEMKKHEDIIDELISEFGYRTVADAFGIARRQYYYKFDEYTIDPEMFESDVNPFDYNDKFWLYKAYCRWCGYWPALISAKSMNVLKEYEKRVRHCHGEFFTLTVKRLHLTSAVILTLLNRDDHIHEHWDEGGSVNENYPYVVDSSEYTMTDAEFQMMHDQFQAKQIKALILDLLDNPKDVKPEFIREYTLCKTRSVTDEGWGPDVFVLSKDERAEIIHKLINVIGTEAVANCFSQMDLHDAGVDLGIDTNDKVLEYEYDYLRNADCRENGYAIFGEDLFKPLYRPSVNTEKYLLSTLELKKIEVGWGNNGLLSRCR